MTLIDLSLFVNHIVQPSKSLTPPPTITATTSLSSLSNPTAITAIIQISSSLFYILILSSTFYQFLLSYFHQPNLHDLRKYYHGDALEYDHQKHNRLYLYGILSIGCLLRVCMIIGIIGQVGIIGIMFVLLLICVLGVEDFGWWIENEWWGMGEKDIAMDVEGKKWWWWWIWWRWWFLGGNGYSIMDDDGRDGFYHGYGGGGFSWWGYVEPDTVDRGPFAGFRKVLHIFWHSEHIANVRVALEIVGITGGIAIAWALWRWRGVCAIFGLMLIGWMSVLLMSVAVWMGVLQVKGMWATVEPVEWSWTTMLAPSVAEQYMPTIVNVLVFIALTASRALVDVCIPVLNWVDSPLSIDLNSLSTHLYHYPLTTFFLLAVWELVPLVILLRSYSLPHQLSTPILIDPDPIVTLPPRRYVREQPYAPYASETTALIATIPNGMQASSPSSSPSLSLSSSSSDPAKYHSGTYDSLCNNYVPVKVPEEYLKYGANVWMKSANKTTDHNNMDAHPES